MVDTWTASVAGVFRETFAGRREPAPCPDAVTCGEGREVKGMAGALKDVPPIKPPPGRQARFG